MTLSGRSADPIRDRALLGVPSTEAFTSHAPRDVGTFTSLRSTAGTNMTLYDVRYECGHWVGFADPDGLPDRCPIDGEPRVEVHERS